MNINEIKHRNLLRLVRKYNCEEPTRLAVILGNTKQYASALLLGTAPLGNQPIKKLCTAWKIAPDEFVKTEQDNQNEKYQPEQSSQERIMLLTSMQKQMDGLQKQIDILTIGINSEEAFRKNINERLTEFAKTGDRKKLLAG